VFIETTKEVSVASFTTRVELKNASTYQDYANLHAAMERCGFARVIRSDNGVTYQMPPAEYNFEGTATIDQIVSAASGAAATTGLSYSVFVTEAVRRSWQNLVVAVALTHA
jgi:hypothetical protein